MKKFLLLLASIAIGLGIVFTGCEADFASENITSDDATIDGADLLGNRHIGQSGEPVVLVHGNAGYPSHWNRTISYLKSKGWSSSLIYTPNWGSKTCPACNDHCGSELTAVKNALIAARNASATGKIDVMGHSMGATLAAYAIYDLGWGSNQVRTFVGIAGGFRGLNSCTFASYTSTCSKSCGLHYRSTILSRLKSKGRWAQKQYAIFSYADEVVCIGGCFIYGVHTSKPYTCDGYKYKSTAPYGHFGILYYTESWQEGYLDN